MPAMEALKIKLRELWRRASYVFSRYSSDRISENAAALTYICLLYTSDAADDLYTV